MAMANFKNVGLSNPLSLFSGNSLSSNNVNNNKTLDVMHKGYLIKRKTMKKRYFVLRKETSKDRARLEYYDSERKFIDGGQPRRKYFLKDCSMIGPKSDEKNSCMVALYFLKDSVSFIASNERSVSFIAGNEKEINTWIQKLNDHKHSTAGGSPKFEYEHVWPVDVQQRSLASNHCFAGQQFMCLTNRLLSFVKTDDNSKKEFQLHTIRRCGHVDLFFFIEVGRLSPIGSGMLWMKCEDAFIARNIHEIVGNAMNRGARDRTQSVSDSQKTEVPVITRGRAGSVPASAKGSIPIVPKSSNDVPMCSPSDGHTLFNCLPAYRASVARTPVGSPGSNESAESSSEEEHNTPRHPTPDIDFDSYVSMISPSNTTRNLRSSIDYHCENVHEMDPVDGQCLRQPLNETSYTASSPVSPSVPWAASLHEDTIDGYTSMEPPVAALTSPYIEMHTPIDKKSAPIPVSPDEESSLNSGSSSFTSGTPSSDQRIHELGSGLSNEEMDSLEMRPIRTNSVGSKPEQFKRKNSAPMLGGSPVSHSWSGTPGSYFRILLQGRNPQPRETNLMELDFSKNKSYDYIPGEDKERKTSKEGLWSTLKGHRQRSNSKSSANSKGSDCESRGVEIPQSNNDYYELDFNPSPRSTGSDSSKGYLLMHPPTTSYLSTQRGPRQQSLSEEMSSSLSSCASQDGYVDMTQGSGALAITTTPTESIRRMSNLLVPTLSQEKLPSPSDDLVTLVSLDLQTESEASSNRKNKKMGKRKSLRESTKRKKSESGKSEIDSSETTHKNKSSTSLFSFSNLRRKPSNSKAPLSPDCNSLPKSAKESMIPFSSLTRNKKEEKKIDNEEQRRMGGSFSDLGANSPTTSERKRLSDSIDLSSHREDEMMFFDPTEATKLFRHSNKTENSQPKDSSAEKRVSAYMNLNLNDDATSGSLPSLHVKSPNMETSNYMNMQLGISSPQLSSPAVSPQETTKEDNSYMIMGVPKPKGGSSVIARKPTIPASLLTSQPIIALEKLSIGDLSSERSRSHSGPDGGIEKKHECTRAASACSSPASYSPPTSPSLGSASSLSEGGLSSASSTCTVVNVGAPRGLRPEEGLNYACLDLCEGGKGQSPKPKNIDANSADYAAIDFNRSEGLRNTSLARNASRPPH